MGNNPIFLFVLLVLPTTPGYNFGFKPIAEFDHFILSGAHCSVNLLYTNSENCEWCMLIFHQLIETLTSGNIPFTLKEQTAVTATWIPDYKGICFVKWFAANQFSTFGDLLVHESAIHNGIWIFLIEVIL